MNWSVELEQLAMRLYWEDREQQRWTEVWFDLELAARKEYRNKAKALIKEAQESEL